MVYEQQQQQQKYRKAKFVSRERTGIQSMAKPFN